MNKFITLILLVFLMFGCSGTPLVERATYLESQQESMLKLPADIDSTVLQSNYPIPEVAGSVQGKTPEELEKLKFPPNVLSK